MKTTLNLDDRVMQKLREESARTGRTMTDLVETALRLYLERPPQPQDLPPLPSFHGGGARVDVARRDALYEVMEGK